MSNPKYDAIGIGYNTTRQADPYLLGRMFVHLSPVQGSNYLDVGCGTGNYTIALSRMGIHFTGIDPSEVMLGEARVKSQDIEWVSGTVELLPFNDQIFDGALASLTIHHWHNIKKGFQELFRVLKPGAKIVLFTSSPEQMRGYWLNHYFPEVMKRSIEKMPSVDEVTAGLEASGFEIKVVEPYAVTNDLIDLFLQSGKHRPEIYFDEKVRKGISTFSSLATPEELDFGLNKLRHDLDHDLFQTIKMQYANDLGDYLFLVAEKTADRRP